MTPAGDVTAATYARQIERLWSELAGRPVVLSPKDWSRICDWHARRIPLEVVREAMEEVAGRRRRRGPLRTLSGVERAVEAAWGVILQGRSDDPVGDGNSAAEPATPEQAWATRLRGEVPGSRLHALLNELLERLDRGEGREVLDEELDRALPDAAPKGLLEEIRREIDRDIEPYRSRLPPERFAAAHRQGCLDRLRRRLDLPRLSLTGKRG